MDKKTFKKVIQLNDSLETMKELKKKIKASEDVHFGWYDCIYGHSVISFNQRNMINDILVKHDLEIRQEIQDRIDALEREIREL